MITDSSLKRCPKCNGNIFFERDDSVRSEEHPSAWYGWCLQCGFTLYMKTPLKTAEKLEV